MKNSYKKGYLLVLVLVFGAIFFMIVVATIGGIVTQSKVQDIRVEKQRALDIAEAGLNYYKWFLAHNADDTTDGTGLPGPYVHSYEDPETGSIGNFSLNIASSTSCNEVYAIDIYSTGETSVSSTTRTVYGRYARPTVSEFAYIINSNVWAGSDRTIIGPYHSNGIIRMDGTNNSTVTSGQQNWVCDGSIPCSPAPNGTTLDAVYGNGPNSALWSFPSPPINFTGLNVDLAKMQNKAEFGGGIYIPPSGDYGYRVTFVDDGTVVVRLVDKTWSHDEYSSSAGWYTARNLIRSDVPYATYTIDPSCPLIFVEDKVWLEGEVPMKVTIASADIDTPGKDYSIILNDNITYTSTSSGLLAIAEEDVLVGYKAPNDMELNGIFVAQNGHFGRNYYEIDYQTGSRFRNSLTINGTIVSNGRVGTKWASGSTWFGGFNTRYSSYDRNLVTDPPPLTPKVSDTYEFIEWREIE